MNDIIYNKKHSRKVRKIVKNVSKLKDRKIRALRLKSMCDISFSLLVVALGSLLIKYGIDISREEVSVLVSKPETFAKFLKVFGSGFSSIGVFLTILSGKASYERNNKIKELKRSKLKNW